MNYQDTLKIHLAEYKRAHLGIDEPGLFRYRGREVAHQHILPSAHADKNLLEEARLKASAFLNNNPQKRHKDFHHLNSSQAFAFNLFFPYFSGAAETASSLLRALGQEGQLLKWEPEAVPDADEQSNIDVLWTTVDGVKTYCEVKLSEVEFGKASDDDRHRDKLFRTYLPILNSHVNADRLENAEFFKAYQFNRNLWHMVRTERSRLIFLLPRANANLWEQLQRLLSGVTDSTRNRVSAVAIEDVIARLSVDNDCPQQMRAYAGKIGRKYLVGGAAQKDI